ncbi:MAG: hypothetical protein WAM69_08185 [Candidatus Sulfotelmatobacter sp.]
MSVRNGTVLLFALTTVLFLSGCGSSSNKATPPPSGGFSNSNLSGTYIFSFSGVDYTNYNVTNTASFFAVVGALQANGSGGLTGTLDINDYALAVATGGNSVQTGLSATGNYSVTADGRGTGTINVTINNTAVALGVDFVLSSSSEGLITRFDNNGSGSGTIDLQTSGVAQSALQGSYAFGLSGVDSAGNSLSAVGALNLDASGNATGSEDFNDNGDSTNLADLPLTASTVTVGSPSGTAEISASAGALSALGFDVWVIDSTHLKFIETDTTAVLAGDAFVSTQTSFPSGPLVYTMSGEDVDGYPLAIGGLLTSDGTSSISSGLEDVNDGGSIGQAPNVNGTFTPFSGGRTELTLDGIYNGSSGTQTDTFAAYPYNGGIELLEIDNIPSGITVGAAYPQTPSTLAASEGYALNLSGGNNTDEEDEEGLLEWSEVDLIAQFSTNSSGGMTGLYDANNSATGLVSDASLGTGTYANDSNGDGRGTASFPSLQANNNTSVIDTLSFTYYTVNSSTLVFIETDGAQVATGTLELQSASSSSAVRPHLAVLHPVVRAHGSLKQHKK